MAQTRKGTRILGLALALTAFGCGQAAKPANVTLFVAASTKDAVDEIAAAFEAKGRDRVRVVADDSGKLAMQIAEGAPADLLLSANQEWADHVARKGFVKDAIDLLGNVLVIVTPSGNSAHVHGPEDLAREQVQRLALAGPNVPAGVYARQALAKRGVWNAIDKSGKVVSGDNVRATLTYVERGEVDAGIVYMTDARISNRVEVVYEFPATSHEPIRYPLLLLKEGPARDFYRFLQSPKAKSVFQRHGFIVDPH